MKKLTILLFLMFCVNAISQGSTIGITNLHYSARGGEKICKATLEMEIIYSDNSKHEILNEVLGIDDKTKNFYMNSFILSDHIKVVKQLRFYMKTVSKRGGGCGGDNDEIEETIYIDMDDVSCRGTNFYFKEANAGAFEVEHSIAFDYEISNRIHVLPNGIDDIIGYDDEYTITATPGFSASSYNWQFRLTDGSVSWTDLPRPTNPETLVFKASDYLPESVAGKEIEFRIKGCYGHPSGRIQQFLILNTAPHILSNPITTEVSCFGAKDGTVILEFDRAMRIGEILALSIEDLSLPIGERSFKNINNITSFEPSNTLTVTDLPKSSTKFKVVFMSDELYTGDVDHTREFEIAEPSFVVFEEVSTTNVNCFGGSDGTISLQANGGTNNNYQFQLTHPDGTIELWTDFENRYTHTIIDLIPGDYAIRIRDGKGCLAKEVSDPDNDGVLDIGDEIIQTVSIEAPAAPIELVLEDKRDARAAGFTDGAISVRFFGGTANPDGSYNVVWTDENGSVLTSVDGQVLAEGYFVTLEDIGAGSYFVSVSDSNYDAAIQKEGCAINNMEFSISEPLPLTAFLEEANLISCNGSNTFNDPFSDGELVAHAQGGVPLGIFDNSGLPYFYTWKKTDDNGTFQVLEHETDSILNNLNAGRYAVNVTDAHGIIIGEYVSNILVNPLDVVYDLKEPDPIHITFEKGDVACFDSNEGWAEASISGGTGVFELNWSNGETTNRIENLKKGTYLLFVTDEKGCEATAQVNIQGPDTLNAQITRLKHPTCNDGEDGIIEISVSGGVEPYSYQWKGDGLENDTLGTSTTNSTSAVEGLVAGNYSVTVTDANLCAETLQITLENPNQNLIDLGKDRTLCGGQSIFLNATILDTGATYSWTSDTGFSSTSPTIEVSEAGTYVLSVTTPLGCSGGDSIRINTSDTEIDAHFVVSTQAFAGQELALINISSPIGDAVEWFFPRQAEIVAESDETVILRFETPGSYDVQLRSFRGDCYLDFMKSIIVEKSENIPDIGDAELPFIQDFVIYPNPSLGNFKVDITLADASEISLKLFSMASQGLIDQRSEPAGLSFYLDYGFTLASGSYVLLLETAKGSQIRKVLIE